MNPRTPLRRRWTTHLLVGVALLAIVALSVPGSTSPAPGASDHFLASKCSSAGHSPLSEPQVTAVQIPGADSLVGALSCSDRLSGKVIGVMVRLVQGLDRVSRDLSGILGRLEELLSNDGMDAIDDLFSDVEEWFVAQALSCEPAEGAGDDPSGAIA